MYTYSNTLSNQEQFFFNIISKVGCLSVNQSKTILKKFMSCSDLQANRILQSLKHRQYVSISDNETYVTAGVKTNPNCSRPNNKMVRVMHLCIYMVEDANNMLFAHTPSDGTDLIFLANGKMYKVIDLKENELYKINALQQSFNDNKRITSRQKSKNNSDFTYITIFSFSSNVRQNKILEFFENTEISFPSIIVFFENDGIADDPKYKLFSLNMED